MDNILLDRKTIDKMLGYATEIAEKNGLEADFSDKSIEKLDSLLNDFHKAYTNEDDHDSEALHGIALSLGIYVGETIRRKLGSDEVYWRYGVPTIGGDPTPYLFYAQNELYPVDWILKQMIFGRRESLYPKYYKLSRKLSLLLGS